MKKHDEQRFREAIRLERNPHEVAVWCFGDGKVWLDIGESGGQFTVRLVARDARELARMLAQAAELSEGPDMAKVDELRAKIAAGTYETPAKLERVADRLVDELAQGGEAPPARLHPYGREAD